MQVVDIFYETLQRAYRNGIKVVVSEDLIIKDGLDFGGYFDQKERELGISTVYPRGTWIPIFIHESCHMDQWIEDSEVWIKNSSGVDGFIDWLQHKIEVDDREELSRICKAAQEIEIDCEKRTVKKCHEWGIKLPKDYIKKANSYILSYQWCMKNRKWMGDYEDKRILKKIPNEWMNSYDLSDDLSEIMNIVYSESDE